MTNINDIQDTPDAVAQEDMAPEEQHEDPMVPGVDEEGVVAAMFPATVYGLDNPIVRGFFEHCYENSMKRPSNTGYTEEERAEITKHMVVDHDAVASGLVVRAEDADKWQVEWDKSFDTTQAAIAVIRKNVNNRSKDTNISNTERFLEDVNQYASVFLAMCKEMKFSVGDHTYNMTQRVSITEGQKGCTVQVSSRKRTGIYE